MSKKYRDVKKNDEIGAGYNDDPLWLMIAAAAYLKETGDFGILEEEVIFANGGPSASFYAHLVEVMIGE